MSGAATVTTGRRVGELPGAAVILRIRHLFVVAVIASAAYSMLVNAQRSWCAGDSTAAAVCTSMKIGASPLVPLALAGIVFVALGRVVRRATDETGALRIIDRAALIVVIVAAASVVIAQVWFWLIPIPDLSGPYQVIFPFPFASGSLTTSP